MSKTVIFIQVQGRNDVLEAELTEPVTHGGISEALVRLGINIDAESHIFLDEAEDHLHGERHEPIHGVKQGCRIHICRCRRIQTMIHFLDQTAEHSFPPGVRVRTVKAWAVAKFKIDRKDASEHVLQLCNSSERPPTDTPLQQLVQGHHCEVCFDLVPEKRVEG